MKQYAALVHLAWAVQAHRRHLIFGWIEIFPPGYPEQTGHPYIPMDEEPIPGTRLYVGRFPMSQTDAERLYQDVALGQMTLPAHPEKPSPGDGQPVSTGLMEAEPPGGQSECLAMGLPFVSAVHGGLHVSGLFGIPEVEVRRAVLQSNANTWLSENLHFPLEDHPEYIGAMLRVRHDPIIRTVEQHLAPHDDTDDEVIRITTWPGTDFTGCEILALEQRPFGVAAVLRERLQGPVHVLHWPHKIEHTGIAIIHPKEGLCWWREPLPYIRSIKLGVTPIGRRKLIELQGPDGTVKDRYEVHESLGLASQSLIGEQPNPGAISSRYYSARQMRKQRSLRKSLGFRWFDDPDTAAKEVRALIRSAQVQVWIIDPYFVGEPLVRFAFAAPEHVLVRILTSAKALKAKLEDHQHYAGQRLNRLLQESVAKNIHGDIKVWVMPGREPPIHDRFLIIDNKMWLSGNSLNAIGERPSVLIEIPDPLDIVEKLAPFQDEAVPFEKWFAEYIPEPPPSLLERTLSFFRKGGQ